MAFNDLLSTLSENAEEEVNDEETSPVGGDGADSDAQGEETSDNIEDWTIAAEYYYYGDYDDSNYSVVDGNKSITFNNTQAIVAREANSQLLPFRIPRYYDGFDLIRGFIQLHWVNSNGEGNRATAVNVRYNDEYIRFCWLLGPDVAASSGKITFEIDIVGANSKGETYRYISKNASFDIVSSLGDHSEIEIDQDWVEQLISQVGDQLGEATELVQDARDAAQLASDYAASALSTVQSAEQTLQTYVDDNMQSVVTSALDNYYDMDAIDNLLSGLNGLADFGVTYDESTNHLLFYNKSVEYSAEEADENECVPVEVYDPTLDEYNTVYYEQIGDVQINSLDNLGINYDSASGKLTLYNKGQVVAEDGITVGGVMYAIIGEVTIYSDPTASWTASFRSSIGSDISSAVSAVSGDVTSYTEDVEDGQGGTTTIDHFKTLVVYEQQTDADLASIHSAIDDLPTTLATDYYTKDATDTLLSAKANSSDLTTLSTNLGTLESTVAGHTSSLSGYGGIIEGLDSRISNLEEQDSSNTTYDVDYNSETGAFSFYTNPTYDQDENITGSDSLKVFTIQGGGGGGGGTSSTITLRRITSTPAVSLINGGVIDDTVIRFTYSSVDSEEQVVAGEATCVWKLDRRQIATSTCEAGTNSFNVTPYLSEGNQTLTLQVTDPLGTVKSTSWVIKVIEVRLECTFNDQITYTARRDISVGFIPYGQDIEKTIRYTLKDSNGVLMSSGSYVDTNSGYTRSFSIAGLAHGSYYLDLWMEATVNENVLDIPHVYKDVLFLDSASTVPLIGVAPQELEATEYDSVEIDYYVVDPSTDTPTVTLSVIDSEENVISSETQNLSSNYGTWTYRATTVGTFTLRITCGVTSKDLALVVSELGIDISTITDGLVYDFNPAGRSNASTDTTADEIWTNESQETGIDVALTVSNNFDWINGGYHNDSNGDTYFCVKAGTRAYIDYAMFGTATDIKTTGMEFKAIYRVTNVSNYDTTVISCVDGTNNIGLRINPHEAYINSSASSLYSPLSEEDIIEFEFNVASSSDSVPMVMSYEDGVPCMPLIYSAADVFNQNAAKPVTIGSDYCDVLIYRMRAYNKSLTNKNILDNFIADGRNAAEIVDRYNRNNIYNASGRLTPESVYNACPELRVVVVSTDHFTTSKKDTRSGSTVRCMYKGTAADDPETIRQNNWTATNAGVSGQGTSSDAYGASARNLDLKLNVKWAATSTATLYTEDDGTYTEVAIGSSLSAGTTYYVEENSSYVEVDDITEYCTVTNPGTTITLDDGDAVVKKVALSVDSIPNNYFNVKLNVASSENANNALLQKRYDRFMPYASVAKTNDSRVKNSMEFFNCVVFIQETDSNMSNHVEFADNDIHFYGIGNIGDSKKTDSTRANDPDDPLEFCVELMDVDRPLSEFPTDALSRTLAANDNFSEKTFEYNGNTYVSSYGIRYGDDEDAETMAYISDVWSRFYNFVTRDIDDNDASDVAAWKAEFQQWFILEDAMYYYLFTLYNTMIDNRAKNTFWHYAKCEDGAYRFSFWDYDNDSSLGINNTGKLTMTYGVEDFDKDDQGNYHFRCANSTFFVRLAKYFATEIAALYNNIQAACWSATDAIGEFDAWQEQFPEELWRLDFERKYLRPYNGTVRDPNASPVTYFFEPASSYLESMANGRKKYQRRQFLRNQEIYMASKFISSTAQNSKIQLRCSNPTEYVVVPNYTITVTPYMNMYLNVYNGQVQVMHVRATAGEQYTVQVSDSTGADFVYIYSASRIQSLGDLSAMYLNYCDIGAAEKLKEFVIGNPTEGYSNQALTTLTFGSNTLLSSIDMRNTSSLSSAFDFSNLAQLRTLHAEGSAITGVTFANGGMLQAAYLPHTLTTINAKNLHYLETFELEGLNSLAYLIVENCPAINTLYLVQNSPLLSRVRLIGLDWDSSYGLQNTDVFDDLMALGGFDSSDAITAQSVLTGSAYVTVIREQKRYDYAAIWPQLVFSYGSEINTVIATFVNEDGTVLDVQYIDRGSAAVDPTTRAVNPIATPAKASTVDKVYTFSGWNNSFVSLFDNITYIAQYSATTRQYTINYAVLGSVKQTTVADYGSTVIYSGETPTYTAEESAYNYYLFKEWDQSGFVTGDKTINAVFDNCTYTSGYFDGKDLSEMRPVEIYALTQAARQTTALNVEDYVEVKDSISFEMGTDFNYSDVEQVEIISDAANALYSGSQSFDGSSIVIDTGIRLFDEDKDWVLAVDYKFASDCGSNTNLMYCRFNSNQSGLRLYTTGASVPRFGYGPSLSTTAASLGSRDILVIRHTKGESALKVYKGNLPASSISYEEMNVSAYQTNTEQTLVFGAAKTSEGYESYAKGTIYWAKLWYADLGDTACRELSSWTHETIEAEVSGFRKYYFSDGSERRSSMTFLGKYVLENEMQMFSSNTNSGGWAAAPLNLFLNSRFYSAIPIQWRGLIKRVIVTSTIGNASRETSTSDCYVYVPALIEVDAAYDYEPYSYEGSTTSWMTSTTARLRAHRDQEGYSSYYTRSPNPDSSNGYMWYVGTDGTTAQWNWASTVRGIIIEFSV